MSSSITVGMPSSAQEDRRLIAFVRSGHETVPDIAATPPRGVVVTFEVDNADATYANAVALSSPVLVELVAELGQRHFMITDPDGAVVDVVQRVALTGSDLRRLARYRRAHDLGSETCH